MTMEESVEKLKAMIHLESLDIVKLMSKYDSLLSGAVSQQHFLRVLTAAGLTDREVYDVIQTAPRTPIGDILYRQLALKLEKEPLTRTRVRLQEASNIDSLRVKAANFLSREYFAPGTVNQVDFDNLLRRCGMAQEERLSVWADLTKPFTSADLQAWTKRYASKHYMTLSEIDNLPSVSSPYPEVLNRLRADVNTIGLLNAAGVFCVQASLTQEEVKEVLLKMRLVKSSEEFSHFMEWAIQAQVVTSYGAELVLISERLVSHLKDAQPTWQSDLPGEHSRLDSTLSHIHYSILDAKLKQLQQTLQHCSVEHYVDEYNVRQVISGVFQALHAREINLLLNSVPHVLPPTVQHPYRRFYIEDLISLLSDAQIPRNRIKLPPEAFIPQPKQEETVVSEQVSAPSVSAGLSRKDWVWEAAIIKKLGSVDLTALLRNFTSIETEGTGRLSVERFHWVLHKSLPFMSREELFFLVHFAVQLNGTLSPQRTAEVQANLPEFVTSSHTISRRLFPDGSQYDINYGLFLLETEKLASKIL
jgi:hypothetical protein